MIGTWAGLAAAVLATAFFALAELALLSTSRIQLRQWVRRTMEGETWVRAADVVERPYRLLSPILVGRALAVTAAAMFAGRLTGAALETGPLAAAAVAAILLAPPVYLLDVFAGGITQSRAHQLFPVVSFVLRLCSWIFRPLVLAADAVASLLRPASPPGAPSPVSGRRVLEALLDESERAGVVQPAEREIIAGVFEFGRTPVAAVMTPWDEMVVAPAGSRAREVSAIIRASGYSRIPLHGRDPRHIVGMVHVFDVYKREPHERPRQRRVVMSDPARPCDELLVEMKRRRCHLGVVAEGKRAIGMVTMEDLVEELVGEIRDEHDARGERRASPLIVDAQATMAELNARHNVDLPATAADTVEGWLTGELGRVPQAGEEVRLREWAVEVLEASPGRVRRVRLRRRISGRGRAARPSPSRRSG